MLKSCTFITKAALLWVAIFTVIACDEINSNSKPATMKNLDYSKSTKVTSFNKDWLLNKPNNIRLYRDGRVEIYGKNRKTLKVNLPHTWNDKDMQSTPEFFAGTMIYHKYMQMPAKIDKSKQYFLKFEGVGHVAHVRVNNVLVGTHKGGYSAFCYNITRALKPGKNSVVVTVDNKATPEIIPINHNLFGVFGGIYRDVYLIEKNNIFIVPTDMGAPGVYVTQKSLTDKLAEVNVAVELNSKVKADKNIDVIVTAVERKSGKVVACEAQKINLRYRKNKTASIDFKIKNPHRWHGIKDPFLYDVKVAVCDGNTVLDQSTQPLGLRTFRVDPEKGFFLNGKPYRLYGVCRHQDYLNKGSALSKEDHKRDIELIKEIGATTLRLAHYQQADYIYELCDEAGIIVWAEIPLVNHIRYKERPNSIFQLCELIKQNYNHPSICFWGVFNEITTRHKDEYQPMLANELQRLAQKMDPTRLTTCASADGEIDNSLHWITDLQAFNRYHGWYGGKAEDFGTEIDKFHAAMPTYPIGISEYGAGANIEHQQINPPCPDARGPFFPEEYQNKFHEIHWQAIKARKYLWASYVWNMFDFAVPTSDRGGVCSRNHKGLVTYDRKIKKDCFYFYKANWTKEPVLYLANHRHKQVNVENVDIKAYSNLQNLKLYHNGKLVSVKPKTNDVCVTIWKNIPLANGENKFKVTATDKAGKEFIYECVKFKKVAAPKIATDAKFNDKLVYRNSFEVNLETKTKDAQIRYTLDGSEPTEKSKLFTKPFKVSSITILRFRAFKKGFVPSDEVAAELIGTIQPALVKLEKQPAAKYPGKGADSLFDMQRGDETHKDKSWLGYKKDDFVANIDLGKKVKLAEVRLGILGLRDAWILPPVEVKVFGSDDGEKFTLLGTDKGFDYSARLVEAKVKTNANVRYLKVVAKNHGKLPKWHCGAGNLCWLFVDEIMIVPAK